MERQVAFDQRNEQVGIATPTGFIIYECLSGLVLYEGKFPGVGGAVCLSLLSDSNLVAASGDDSQTGFSAHSVLLWDLDHDKVVHIVNVQNAVFQIVFRSDCLIVCHGDQITFYDSCDFTLTFSCPNPNPFCYCISLIQGTLGDLIAVPSATGESIYIKDYHEPGYILGEINQKVTKNSFFAFDNKGELLAVVAEEGKMILLFSVSELKLIAKYKRGFRFSNVTGIAFDYFSNFFLITTARGSLYVYHIPTPFERRTLVVTKPIKSRISYEFPKGKVFKCQFTVTGYIIIGVSNDDTLIQLRLDIEKQILVPIANGQKSDSK